MDISNKTALAHEVEGNVAYRAVLDKTKKTKNKETKKMNNINNYQQAQGVCTRPTAEGEMRKLQKEVEVLRNEVGSMFSLMCGRDEPVNGLNCCDKVPVPCREVLCEMIEGETLKIVSIIGMVRDANEVLCRQLNGVKME